VLNVHAIHNVKQTEIHTAEPLVPERSLSEVEIAIGKLKRYKSPSTDQVSGELIKAEVKHYVLRYTNLLVLHRIRRNYHSS
jgi:hypothetical protein